MKPFGRYLKQTIMKAQYYTTAGAKGKTGSIGLHVDFVIFSKHPQFFFFLRNSETKTKITKYLFVLL